MFTGNLLQEAIYKPNYSNAKMINFTPQVDEIIIFPSKTLHSTELNVTDDDRISIAADVSIFAKNSEKLEMLLTPLKKWEKF